MRPLAASTATARYLYCYFVSESFSVFSVCVGLSGGVVTRLLWLVGWLGSRVVSMLDSGTEGFGFKLQSRHCRVAVVGKLFTSIVPLFTKQQKL